MGILINLILFLCSFSFCSFAFGGLFALWLLGFLLVLLIL